MKNIEGRLQLSGRGFGFVIPSDRELPDIFIPHEGLQDAMHGDQVLVRLVERAAVAGRKAEGQIVKILQRANTHIVGTFTIRRGIAVAPEAVHVGRALVPAGLGPGPGTGQQKNSK